MTIPWNGFERVILTGGAFGSLDGIDGANLKDGDIATVTTSTSKYFFRLNATSGASEVSPYIITPNTNAGNKRWILMWVTGAAKPMFMARLTSDVGNVTGDGTAYTITGWTERYDQASNFNASSGVFTAPATGIYTFKLISYLYPIINTHTDVTSAVQTTDELFRSTEHLMAYNAAGSHRVLSLSFDCPMDIGETAYPVATVAGSTKTVGLFASTTWFSGRML